MREIWRAVLWEILEQYRPKKYSELAETGQFGLPGEWVDVVQGSGLERIEIGRLGV
jgi:hypothetical protein